ncbi:hypothetical protein ACWPM1_12005 [Tsuneonella sp. HG249]
MTSLTGQLLRWPRWRAARSANTGWLRAIDARLTRPAVWLGAVTFVFALQALLIAGHRPWLDEVQAVQLAVEAPDLATLFAWLRYEGHPPLFYLILRGLAHVMEPLATLPVLAAALAAITQACILFRSPFTRAERLLIALSTFVLFDFLTLSRSMTLGVALIVVATAYWRSRWVWLVIALLPMCDFLFGVISGILVLLKLRERQLFWPGALLWLGLGLLAAWSVRPAEDIIPAVQSSGFAQDFLGYVSNLGALALPFQGGLVATWNAPPFPLAGILWIPFLLLCWTTTQGDRFQRLLLFGFIGLTFVFSMVVYPLAIRHLMLIALLVIVFAWFRRERGEVPQPGFRLWLAVSAACGLATAAINLALPFNTAPEAAAEIERLGLADKHWMAWPDFRSPVVSTLTGIDFEQTGEHCMMSAMKWNHRTRLTKPARLQRYLKAEVARHGQFYLLSDRRIRGFDPNLIQPVAEIPAGYDGQAHNLYLVGPNAPEISQSLPPCIAHRRPFTRLTAQQP